MFHVFNGSTGGTHCDRFRVHSTRTGYYVPSCAITSLSLATVYPRAEFSLLLTPFPIPFPPPTCERGDTQFNLQQSVNSREQRKCHCWTPGLAL